MNWSPEKRLSSWRIPHLRVVLEEIFYCPPPSLFPDQSQPLTLGALAAKANMPLHEVASRLDLCEQMSEKIEISNTDLAQLLRQVAGMSDTAPVGSEAPILLDVRMEWEYAICRIPGSILLSGADFPALLARLLETPQQLVVTVCHHGVRSYSAALFLREKGLRNVQSLAGGVEAWAQTIDPSMPRY